jgi:hypothetical protein
MYPSLAFTVQKKKVNMDTDLDGNHPEVKIDWQDREGSKHPERIWDGTDDMLGRRWHY